MTPENKSVNDFNDCFRPHYDEVFDEAISRNYQGVALDPQHIRTLDSYLSANYLQKISLERGKAISLQNK